MKHKILLILILSVFLFTLSARQSVAQNSLPHVETYTLENGLTVILNEDHTKQKVFGVVAVKAGAKDDPEDATGMAHYQEHMLFKGTDELGTTNWEEEKKYIDEIFALYDELGETTDETERAEIQKKINEASLKANEFAIPNELSNIIKSMGGTSLNAGTGWDQTLFFNAFPPNEIERWLDLYSHRFMNPVFRGFQAELEVVYEEKNLYNDMFQTQMIEAFSNKFYKNHPYGQQTIIGTADDLKNPSLTKMYAFFKTWYVPNNMALVITGDFDTETIKPIIAEKFGRLKAHDIPERKTYPEEAFEGREFFEDRLSPIKLGILGFRTVPAGHPDELALDVANQLLSNQNQTGLLDELTINNELMAAVGIPMIMNDHGGTLFLYIPKLVGQSLEDAEQLVLSRVKKLTEGEFSDEAFKAVKQRTYLDFLRSLEDLEQKAVLFATLYTRGENINDYMNYPERIQKLTKEDVIKTAKKYYGENYLAFYSKMGSPDKEKIEKPGYKPLITNTNKQSEYAKYFESLKVPEAEINYINFSEALSTAETKNGTKIYASQNPVNEIFEMEYRINRGQNDKHLLQYVSQLADLAQTKDKETAEVKADFAALGLSYSFASDDDYFYVRLRGSEKNLEKGLELLNDLLTQTVIKQERMNVITEGVQQERKIEKSEPANVADALFEYVKYREKSDYIDRLTLKDIKKLETAQLTKLLHETLSFEASVFYSGKTDANALKALADKYLHFADTPVKNKVPKEQTVHQYNENTIYLVDKPKALQSKVYFLINGKTYNVDESALIDAYNQYFGGGFSGLVLQEIREYRSMAYSAGAFYKKPVKAGFKTTFYGYVGTQSDKTIEALKIFNGLMRDMPEKPERMAMIKHYLVQSALSSTPSFRELPQQIDRWKTLGYTEDPRKVKIEAYHKLKFEDIVAFHNENLKTKPMVIAVVGDKDRIDTEVLQKFGKLVEIKEKELFTD